MQEPLKFHRVAINPYPSKDDFIVLFGGESQTEPGHRAGPAVLDYLLVHYVISGSGIFKMMGKEYSLGAGDSFFIFPGELYMYEADQAEPWRYCWIGFKGRGAETLLSSLNISAHRPVVRTQPRKRIPTLFRLVQQVFQDGGAFSNLQARGYMDLLLAEFARHNRTAGENDAHENEPEITRQVKQAIRWMTLQYSQPVSIEDMAQSLGYHRIYFSKMFKEYTGMAPTQFLLKIRMERAKQLLAGRLTIDQIAASVGFADALYFSKQYKKWFGVPPTEHRKSMLGKSPFDCKV